VTIPFVLLGNPENRRVGLFQAALAAQGHPPARVFAWRDVARDPSVLESLPDEPAWFRIDSFGEDFEVEKLLLVRGAEDARTYQTGPTVIPASEVAGLVEDHGRIVAPRQMHLGFLRVLRDVAAILARKPRVHVLQPPSTIEAFFDKGVTSRRCAEAGIPVPEAFAPTGDLTELRARVAGEQRVYVKLTCGSSASCLAIWTLAPRESIVTTIEIAQSGWYNSLRLRQYTDRTRVDEILRFLLREGAHVERAIPKARLDGRHTDCRVLVVEGEPTFSVLRTSRHPITNLHLGGQRADVAALALDPAVHEAAMESCRAVARVFPCHHVGVDLMFEADLRGHRVLEANAFGDLLPGLVRDGLSVYEWEIRALGSTGNLRGTRSSTPSP
jgi:hypothetical protein